MKVENRYINGDYFARNPTWDTEDSYWKCMYIKNILDSSSIHFQYVADVGCGAGNVSHMLASKFPSSSFHGYDISPQLPPFWKQHNPLQNLEYRLDDFLNSSTHYDLILLIDVLEHLRDPLTFLENIAPRTKYILFHLPLDLSAFTILRSKPLLSIRETVGHLHSYTRDLAHQTLIDSGLTILDSRYSKAWLRTSSHLSVRRLLALLPRYILSSLNQEISARLLGGETLFVLTSTSCSRSTTSLAH